MTARACIAATAAPRATPELRPSDQRRRRGAGLAQTRQGKVSSPEVRQVRWRPDLLSSITTRSSAGSLVAFPPLVRGAPSGLSNAAATLVGQNLGARRPERAEQSVWQACLASAAFLTAVGVVFLIGARLLVGLFTPDPEVVEHGVTRCSGVVAGSSPRCDHHGGQMPSPRACGLAAADRRLARVAGICKTWRARRKHPVRGHGPSPPVFLPVRAPPDFLPDTGGHRGDWRTGHGSRETAAAGAAASRCSQAAGPRAARAVAREDTRRVRSDPLGAPGISCRGRSRALGGAVPVIGRPARDRARVQLRELGRAQAAHHGERGVRGAGARAPRG